MPEIYVHAVKGRSMRPESALMKDITEAVVKTFRSRGSRGSRSWKASRPPRPRAASCSAKCVARRHRIERRDGTVGRPRRRRSTASSGSSVHSMSSSSVPCVVRIGGPMAPQLEVTAFTHQGRVRDATRTASPSPAGSPTSRCRDRGGRGTSSPSPCFSRSPTDGRARCRRVTSRHAINALPGNRSAGVDDVIALAAINAELYQTMAAAARSSAWGRRSSGSCSRPARVLVQCRRQPRLSPREGRLDSSASTTCRRARAAAPSPSRSAARLPSWGSSRISAGRNWRFRRAGCLQRRAHRHAERRGHHPLPRRP